MRRRRFLALTASAAAAFAVSPRALATPARVALVLGGGGRRG